MEDIPPSYESAINRDAWTIVAPWIPSSDLCSASLVCRRWHEIFAPFLWGNPASHFGTENDAVYVALTRFKRVLKRSRYRVRELTHTLHLPPALSEIYGGPNSTWLRDVLDYLPNLQSLIVSQLPFFDHHSLLALRNVSVSWEDPRKNEHFVPTYGLRLLLAASEPNTTSAGIAEALVHFNQLVYLDLSYTRPAKDPSVLSTIASLEDLRVLKLRGIGLRDEEAEVLANSIALKVRVLDLRNNALTDGAVRSLMQACCLPPTEDRGQTLLRRQTVEDWPIGLPPGPELMSLETLRNQDLDEKLRLQLTSPLTGRLAIEDIPHKGLTHLYIADNRLSVEGLLGLLKSSRLHVLDAGSVDTANCLTRATSISSENSANNRLALPGPEKIVPVLQKHAGKILTYMRINHAVVTKGLVGKDVLSPQLFEVPGDAVRAELQGSTSLPTELETNEAVFELPAEATDERAELPGDPIHFALFPPINQPPGACEPAKASVPIRGDGAFAPEPLNNDHNEETSQNDNEVGFILNATGSGLTAKTSRPESSSSATQLLSSVPPSSLATSSEEHHSLKSPYVLEIDRLLHKRAFYSSDSNATISSIFTRLHPSSLPHLQTLVLTDVPAKVPQSSTLIPALQAFISACADEAWLATLQAQTTYSLPPGRNRISAEHAHAKTLFALSSIVFEMSPVSTAQTSTFSASIVGGKTSKLSSWVPSHNPYTLGKSSTGDRDSDNLWNAAENDFSFFGEEGEEQAENGVYENEPEKYFHMTALNEKVILEPEDVSAPSTPNSLRPPEPSVKSPTLLPSPRSLPLRKRTTSASSSRGSIEGSERPAPTSVPRTDGTPLSLSRANGNALRPVEEPLLDVVAELAKFRSARKAEYEAALHHWRTGRRHRNSQQHLTNGLARSPSPAQMAQDLPFVEGYWKGNIKIIRSAAPKGRSGLVDIYGNYFEKGYLYP